MTDADSTPSPAATTRPAVPAMLACVALYLVAAALLLWRLPGDPPFPHNWEAYTAWRVATFWGDGPDLAGVLAPTDGLMTDSGQGPLVGLPVWIGFGVAGVGLGAMRVPAALVSAAAVPLLWLVARRVALAPVAWLAAAVLALSPVWLLYGRTATIVAPSLVPLLLATWALLRVVEPPVGAGDPAEPNARVDRWAAVVLCAAFAGGLFAYAPVRLLWPMAVVIVLLAAWRQPARRRGLAVVAVAALLSVPLAVVVAETVSRAEPRPVAAVASYFNARGEQVLAFDPDDYARYLPPDAVPLDASPGPTTLVLANAGDLLRLLADVDTLPVREEYWSPRGRLWPAALGVLFALGGGWAAWRALRKRDWRAGILIGLTGGLVLPLLLTTRVHVGRLVPALPFLLVFVAWGGWLLIAAAGRVPLRAGGLPLRLAARIALVAGLAGLAVGAAASEWKVAPAVPREAREVEALALLATETGPAGAIAALDPALGQEIVEVRAAGYRLTLDDVFRVSALPPAPAGDAAGRSASDSGLAAASPATDAAGSGARHPLLVGDAVAWLEAGALPDACASVWAVQPEIEDRLHAALAAACGVEPSVTVLPR